jgi:hypothetical protein
MQTLFWRTALQSGLVVNVRLWWGRKGQLWFLMCLKRGAGALERGKIISRFALVSLNIYSIVLSLVFLFMLCLLNR